MSLVGRLSTITSEDAKTSGAEGEMRTPADWAASRAAGETSKPATVKPAAMKRLARALPMRPRPMRPMGCGGILSVFLPLPGMPGRGGGRGGQQKHAHPDSGTFFSPGPLSLTLSPEYRGEG